MDIPERIVEGKVVVVTGAGGGIGSEIAKMMAQQGARVVVNDVGSSVKGEGRNAGPGRARRRRHARRSLDHVPRFRGSARKGSRA